MQYSNKRIAMHYVIVGFYILLVLLYAIVFIFFQTTIWYAIVFILWIVMTIFQFRVLQTMTRNRKEPKDDQLVL